MNLRFQGTLETARNYRFLNISRCDLLQTCIQVGEAWVENINWWKLIFKKWNKIIIKKKSFRLPVAAFIDDVTSHDRARLVKPAADSCRKRRARHLAPVPSLADDPRKLFSMPSRVFLMLYYNCAITYYKNELNKKKRDLRWHIQLREPRHDVIFKCHGREIKKISLCFFFFLNKLIRWYFRSMLRPFSRTSVVKCRMTRWDTPFRIV